VRIRSREDIMSVIIRTENLFRQFKTGEEIVYALKDININIKAETLTILRGRSGSGKTTLINLLGGMDLPSKGKVYFEEEDITKISDRKRDALRRASIGFVFQSGGLMSNMTALENVEFGLRIAGFNPKERRKRAEECLAMVGLTKRILHFPRELSGGEAQRVAIARSVAHKPKVIFADEPTAALDANMGLQVVNAFKYMVEKEKITVIMTTHDPSMMEIADQVYTLQDGEVVNE
jgi:putative ABC transport system ATP-binding protein